MIQRELIIGREDIGNFILRREIYYVLGIIKGEVYYQVKKSRRSDQYSGFEVPIY